MKTLFGLVGKKVVKTASGIEVDLINALNSLDPELVQEYQIEQYEKDLTALTRELVKAEDLHKKEKAEFDAITKNYNDMKADAEKLLTAIEDPTMTDAMKKQKFQLHLDSLLAQLEDMKDQIPLEEEDEKNAMEHYTLLKEAVENAAKKLATAKQTLTRKQNEIKRLDAQEGRMKDQEEAQKRLMGLAEKVNKFSGVVDAMDKEIAKKKQNIAASKVKTEALKRVAPAVDGEADADIAALLKKEAPPQKSAAERLKSL
jgi:chromosome segregation ATPase